MPFCNWNRAFFLARLLGAKSTAAPRRQGNCTRSSACAPSSAYEGQRATFFGRIERAVLSVSKPGHRAYCPGQFRDTRRCSTPSAHVVQGTNQQHSTCFLCICRAQIPKVGSRCPGSGDLPWCSISLPVMRPTLCVFSCAFVNPLLCTHGRARSRARTQVLIGNPRRYAAVTGETPAYW